MGGGKEVEVDRGRMLRHSFFFGFAGQGTKLAAFAAPCFENEYFRHLRSLKRSRKDVSLHDRIGTDKEGNDFTLISTS